MIYVTCLTLHEGDMPYGMSSLCNEHFPHEELSRTHVRKGCRRTCGPSNLSTVILRWEWFLLSALLGVFVCTSAALVSQNEFLHWRNWGYDREALGG